MTDTVTLVGNGPSSLRHGEEIDAASCVIRCNECVGLNAGAGSRLDVLAWFGVLPGDVTPPRGNYEHWLTLPPCRCLAPHIGRPAGACSTAGGVCAIRWIMDSQWALLGEQLARIGQRSFTGGSLTAPTTGITAVAMVLRILRPSVISLYGFDATAPDAPNFGRGPEAVQHDFAAEKLYLAALMDHGTWLGQVLAYPAPKVLWPDRPALDTTWVKFASTLTGEPPPCC